MGEFWPLRGPTPFRGVVRDTWCLWFTAKRLGPTISVDFGCRNFLPAGHSSEFIFGLRSPSQIFSSQGWSIFLPNLDSTSLESCVRAHWVDSLSTEQYFIVHLAQTESLLSSFHLSLNWVGQVSESSCALRRAWGHAQGSLPHRRNRVRTLSAYLHGRKKW